MRDRLAGALARRRLLVRTVASVAQAGAGAASVVVSLLAVHFAGIGTWGVFLAAMVLVRLCAQVANFGTRDHLLGEFAREPAQMQVGWGRNVAARAWLLALGPPVFLAAGADLPRAAAMTVWLVGLFVAQSYDSLVTYRRAFAFAFWLEVGGTALTCGAIVLRGAALTADDLILAFALVCGLKAAALAIRFSSFRPRFGPPDLAELRGSWSFFMLTFSGAIQGRVDLYAVAVLLPAAELGAYGVLTNFVLLTQSISGALLAPVVPLLYRLPRARVWRGALRLFAIGVPVTLASATVTVICLDLLYGIHPSPLTMLAAWAAMLPCFLFTPLVYFQFRRGQARLVVYGSVLGTVISLAGTLALAPSLGIAGAMVAAALAQAGIAAFHVALFRRVRQTTDGRINSPTDGPLPRCQATRRALALAVASLALLVLLPCAVLIGRNSFDGLYGQDSFSYVGYALGPLTEALRHLQLPPPFFWPPGFPLLVAGVGAPGLGDSAGQLVSLLAGALVPIFVALLARQLVAPSVAPGTGSRARRVLPLLAGAVAALAGQLWQSSVVQMSDTTGLAAATIGAWAVCRYLSIGSRWSLVLGAGALAFAIEVRWIYALVALPLATATLVALGRAVRTERRAALGDLAVGAASGMVVLLPTLGPIASALAAGLPVPFVGDFGAYQHWSPLGALSRTFETLDGRLEYSLPTGLFYLLQPFQPYWTFVLGLLAVPGLVAVAHRPAVASVAVLIGWPALVVGFLVGSGYQNTRFFLAVLPPVAILVAIGAGTVWRTARQRAPARWRPLAGRAVAVVIACGLVTNALLAIRFTNGFIEWQSAERAAVRALVAQVPSTARLISLGATPQIEHDGRADVVELFFLDADSVLALVSDGRPSYLVLDMASIRSQWAARGPGWAVAALESGVGLEPVATAGGWTLYLVGTAQ